MKPEGGWWEGGALFFSLLQRRRLHRSAPKPDIIPDSLSLSLFSTAYTKHYTLYSLSLSPPPNSETSSNFNSTISINSEMLNLGQLGFSDAIKLHMHLLYIKNLLLH